MIEGIEVEDGNCGWIEIAEWSEVDEFRDECAETIKIVLVVKVKCVIVRDAYLAKRTRRRHDFGFIGRGNIFQRRRRARDFQDGVEVEPLGPELAPTID